MALEWRIAIGLLALGLLVSLGYLLVLRRSIREVADELGEKLQTDTNTLISSHILDELSRLATHYGFIDGGRMVREMSAAELEARCRTAMRIEVSDVVALARVLDGMQAEYRILEENCADIYAKIPVTALVSALEGENCAVISLREQDESLESFYMNLIGGGRHA